MPAHDDIKTWTGIDLARLMAFTARARLDMDLDLPGITGTYLARARERLAQYALDKDATHLFWVDADMRFPRDTLLRLLSHDVPVVGANYTERTPPFFPCGVRDTETNERVYTEETSTGLESVQSIGFGCLLMTTDVLRQIEKPRFMTGYVQETEDHAGEDVYFCRQLKAYGIPLVIDHDLSKDVEHLGIFPYGHLHAKCEMELIP